MDRIRMTDPESPYYRQAMELYAAGFPLHEQRRPEEQIQAMKDPAFHCDALVESGTYTLKSPSLVVLSPYSSI